MDFKPQPSYIWQHADWSRFRIDAGAIMPALSDARRAQGILLGKAQALSLASLPQAENEVWIGEAIATSAIEGEQLNLDAVRSSVAKRLGLNRPAAGPIQRNVEGLLDSMSDASGNWNEPLTLHRLCDWQAALFPTGFSSLHKIRTGALRDQPIANLSGPVGRETVHYEAPAPAVLADEIARFLQWFEASRSPQDSPWSDGILRAGLAHLWFETVHPFEDGNGRVGRTIVDLALAQDARQATRLYGMSRRLAHEREAYYSELETAQKGTPDVTRWIFWFIRQFQAACETSLQILDRSLEKARFWETYKDVNLSPEQRKVVNLLLDAGAGGFEGGMTTSKYISITRRSKASATRDLADLVQEGLLAHTGQLKSTRYWINLPGWIGFA